MKKLDTMEIAVSFLSGKERISVVSALDISNDDELLDDNRVVELVARAMSILKDKIEKTEKGLFMKYE